MNQKRSYVLTRVYVGAEQQETIFAYRDLVTRHKRVIYKRRKRAEGSVTW